MSATLTNALARATIDDLYRVEGKSELIAGRIVHLMPTGRTPSRIAARIFSSLDDDAESTGCGEAYTDNTGFHMPELTSGRESFSPDVARYAGPFPDDEMSFIDGAPLPAVEVRSAEDCGGPAVETRIAAKRRDDFEAGTRIVWDVDPAAMCIRAYRADRLDEPVTLRRDQSADAEPELPGWRSPLAKVFRTPEGKNQP